jgi:hypothetical protein
MLSFLTCDGVVPSFRPRGHNVPLGTLLQLLPPWCGHALRLSSIHNLDPLRSFFTDTRTHPVDRPVRPFFFIFPTCFLDFSHIGEPERELGKLNLSRSSSRNCPVGDAMCECVFRIISLNSISRCETLLELSGEKDWRSCGKGGRAPDFKATTTSGEDTTHMWGLSDTGSVGDISGSAER